MSAPGDRPAVFLDACVLAGALKRHLVLGLAEAGLIYPRWSEKVLFETGHAHARIVSNEPGRDGAGEAARIVTALEAAFPEAMVLAEMAETVQLPARGACLTPTTPTSCVRPPRLALRSFSPRT